jgi:glycosyltransferase involved in cell wall biosynthesis
VRERSLVYSGLLSISRGADLILDAAERMPDVKFVLLAKFMVASEEAYFSNELSRRRLPNVENRGFVPFAEVPLHLSRAGVGIMPWRRTPHHVRAAQPSKIYEYMACGLPILASDLPVTREVILGNECGRLHAADDTDDFVANAYALLDDPVFAESAGASGRLAFEERYSYEAAGQQLLLMYESLVSKPACGPSSVGLAGRR